MTRKYFSHNCIVSTFFDSLICIYLFQVCENAIFETADILSLFGSAYLRLRRIKT